MEESLQVDAPASPFTPQEWARLAQLKTAVRAGLYHEMFTPAEWLRLAIYRAAVRAGFYNEGNEDR